MNVIKSFGKLTLVAAVAPPITKPIVNPPKSPKPKQIKAEDGSMMDDPSGAMEEGGDDGGESEPSPPIVPVPTFELTAYTGSKMTLDGFYSPVIIDLATIKASLPIPLLKQHCVDLVVGHAEKTSISPSAFTLSGKISGVGSHVDEIVAMAGREFPWQVSVGGNPDRLQYVERGQSVVVNGQTQEGPFIIAFGVTIRECSIVPVGGDGNTSIAISATAPSVTNDSHNANQIEASRIDRIKQLGVKYRDDGSVILRAMNEKWTPEQTETHLIQSKRPNINVRSGDTEMDRSDILAAAVLQSTKYERHAKIEGMYAAPVLEAAHKEFRGRLSLQQLFIEAALANSPGSRFTNFRSNAKDILRAAFSTKDISGILSNTANKYMVAGYNSVEQSWREIARIRSVPDFKENTGYRGVGSFTFEKLAAEGEIEHGTMSEATYGNKADTYAKMFAITRQDMYNDDLSLLAELPRQIGRGGSLKFNKVFWTEFLDNSTFFHSSHVNTSTGVLAIAGLSSANTVFKNLKDENGDFVGSEPRILLVPTALEVTAMQLFRDTTIVSGNTSGQLSGNPFAGKFKPVASRYLSDSTMSGTYSAVAYYLLADPQDVPVIEAAFLEGQETPIVEEAQADFNVLGIQMRGYFDFGVRKQDYRAGVRSTGA